MLGMRAFAWPGVLLAAALFVAGCGQNQTQTENAGAPAAGAAGEMVFHRGNGAEPQSLDPHLAGSSWENQIIGDLLMGLTTEDVNAKPIPGAAERWETSDDGMTWTFHLRDHQWSDGMPVTAEDFVYGWRRILDPKTASTYAYYLFTIKNARAVNSGQMPPTALGISAPDAKTLVVQLEHPAPYLAEYLTHYTTFPVPRHVVERHGNQWTRAGNYVGNGAYVLTEWVPNDHVTLVKNPRFYDAANVKVDRVVFYPTQDYDAAFRRFRAGELDVQDRLPAAQIDWIRANMPDVLKPGPQLTIEYYSFNIAREPFDDIRVREALNLALNREMITGTVRRVGEVPAYSHIPPGIANFPHGNAFPFKAMTQAQRIARAQELMRQAGFGPNNRLRTTVDIRSTSADARRVPAAVQQMWREIYVDLEIQPNDTAIFYNKAQEHDFAIAQAAWGADFNDASNFLDLLRTGNDNNYGTYRNPAYDALLDRAQQEKDLTARGLLLKEAEALAMKDYAWAPSHFWVTTMIVQPYVKGYVSNPNATNRTRWVTVERPGRAQ